MLVGRSRELGTIAAALGQVGSGAPAVVVEGEAGIGKTALLDATAGWARERSFAVLACRPAQSEAAMSYGALADLVGGLDEDIVAGLPALQRRTLEAVRLHADLPGHALEQRAVGTALCSALNVLAARTPVLAIIDDAQWLDRPSEQALRFAVRRLGGQPVAVVVTVRAGEGVVDPLGLDAARGGGAVRVVVGGLSLGALHQLLSTRLGVVVARPMLMRIVGATGGNPFYSLELTRTLADRGLLDDPTVALPLPDRLHDLVADRIASLDPPAAHACLVVSALAHPTVDLLLPATGRATWEASGGAAAEDAGIITFDGTAIRFTHPLLRSAVYESARPSARRAVHARLAALLSDPEERSRHLAASVPGTDASVAAELDQGARHAWRRGAREVAAELAERALTLTPQDGARNPRRLVAARFQYEAANPKRARTLLQQVLDDHPTRTERLDAICCLGSVRFYVDSCDRSIALLLGALGGLEEHDHIVRARLHTELSYARIVQGAYSWAVDHGEAGLAAAQAAGDTSLARGAAAPLVWAALLAGQGVRAEVELGLNGTGPTEPFAIDPHMQAAAVLKWGDELDRARSVLTDRYELAQAQGAVAKVPLLAWQIADLEVPAGRWDAAEPLADEALEGARFRGGLALALCAALRARLHALRGRLDAARVDVEEATAAAAGLGGIAAMAALEASVLLETCRDDPAAVHAAAGPVVADLGAVPPTDPAFLRWMPDEVEALTALGQYQPATEVLEWFENRCRATNRRSGWAAAHRCRALLASHDGALDEAVEHVNTSIRLYTEIGMPFEGARSLMVAGSVHRRRRQKAAVSSLLQQAREVFSEVGAPLWAERATQQLGRLGDHRIADRSHRELTAVEADIAGLVAAGLRNREVAGKLFMSHKTVESHLTRIYRKLNLRSRAELAAAMGQQRSDRHHRFAEH